MARRALLALALVGTLVSGCDLVGGGSSNPLTGKVWQWTGSLETQPATQQSVVPDPENYTIEFKNDGTFAAKADCNQVAGTYTTTDSGGLTILPGPSTLAACPEDSQDARFLAQLGAATGYAITTQLEITTSTGTTMYLQST